jgi:hypothetical protein
MSTTECTGRAFALMLNVKQQLVRGMRTGPGHVFTILEVSEDNAAVVIERALKAAERRGERSERKRTTRVFRGRVKR